MCYRGGGFFGCHFERDAGFSHVRVESVPEIMENKATLNLPAIRDSSRFTGSF